MISATLQETNHTANTYNKQDNEPNTNNQVNDAQTLQDKHDYNQSTETKYNQTQDNHIIEDPQTKEDNQETTAETTPNKTLQSETPTTQGTIEVDTQTQLPSPPQANHEAQNGKQERDHISFFFIYIKE